MNRRGGTWTAAAAAAALLGISFYALISWLEQGQLSDLPVYVHWAGLVRGGAVPYRDFHFDYPPAALPVLILPAYMTWSYATSFAVLMGVCGAGCIAAAASALRTVGAGSSPSRPRAFFPSRFSGRTASARCSPTSSTVRSRWRVSARRC